MVVECECEFFFFALFFFFLGNAKLTLLAVAEVVSEMSCDSAAKVPAIRVAMSYVGNFSCFAEYRTWIGNSKSSDITVVRVQLNNNLRSFHS